MLHRARSPTGSEMQSPVGRTRTRSLPTPAETAEPRTDTPGRLRSDSTEGFIRRVEEMKAEGGRSWLVVYNSLLDREEAASTSSPEAAAASGEAAGGGQS